MVGEFLYNFDGKEILIKESYLELLELDFKRQCKLEESCFGERVKGVDKESKIFKQGVKKSFVNQCIVFIE